MKKVLMGLAIFAKWLLRIVGLLLSGCAVFIVMGFQWLFSTWEDLSMDEVVYQLKTPITGTNTDMIYEFLDLCIPPVLIAIFLYCVLIGVANRNRILSWLLPVCLIGISVFQGASTISYAWDKLDVTAYLENASTTSYFIEENYANPHTTPITFPEQKRNLIYIYLESMEATYAHTAEGGGLSYNCIPELTVLANQNVSFSNKDTFGGLYTTTGSTWTMGALVTQTSALPLCLNFRHGYVDESFEILPNAKTLGDVLSEQGYTQEFIMGSVGTFAARDQYFMQHGNYNIRDLVYARTNGWLDDPNYMVWWGYEDSKLFDFAKQEATQLASTGQPFNLTLLTVDTHFEDGYVCPMCPQDYDNQYANVMACSSRQVAEFISWVQQQPFYYNTTIVLVGDHLTMDKDFCQDVDPSYDRTVYNCFINSAVYPVNMKNRIATTLDMFPTTLAALGATIQGDCLGLGTNLFSATPTLTERTSLNTLDSEFQRQSLFYEALAGNEAVDLTVLDE